MKNKIELLKEVDKGCGYERPVNIPDLDSVTSTSIIWKKCTKDNLCLDCRNHSQNHGGKS